MMSDIMVISVLLLACFEMVSCTSCIKCANMDVTGSKGIVGGIQKAVDGSHKKNPACMSPTIVDDNFDTVECPDDGKHTCGSVDASVKIQIPILGSVTYKTVVRDCVKAKPQWGCEDDVDTVTDVINGVITLVNDLPGVDVKIDGNMCYCPTDQCVAGGCKDGQINVVNYCFEPWMLAVSVGLSLVGLLLITGCCCCCCCCCRRKKTPGQILTVMYPPRMQHTNGPAYVQMTEPEQNDDEPPKYNNVI